MWVYFWAFHSTPLLNVSILMPQHFDYCNFIMNLEVRLCKSSNKVLSLQNAFAILLIDTLCFCVNFRISLSNFIFLKRPSGIVTKIALIL